MKINFKERVAIDFKELEIGATFSEVRHLDKVWIKTAMLSAADCDYNAVCLNNGTPTFFSKNYACYIRDVELIVKD